MITPTPYPGRDAPIAAASDGDLAELAAYKTALDQHALIAKTNIRGRITYANDKFCEISQYDRADLIGQDHRLLNSAYHSKEFMADLWNTIRNGKPWHGTIRNRAKDGSFYWVETSIIPILNENGKIHEYLSVRTHIPDLQIAKNEAEEANRAKSEFLAAMSHEIRTPMNGVLGAATLLQGMNLTREVREFVDIIVDSGGLLMNLLNDILDLSKFKAGNISLEEIKFQLSDVVEKVASVHALKASEKDLKFNVKVESDVFDFRLGDPHRITQILHNLLSNAIKFTQDGSVQLTVSSAHEGADGDGAIVMTVSDTGIGMPAEYVDKAFASFVQADSSITRKFGGTGLGLSIVKNIVDAMRGEIQVDTAPGAGSTFRIILPLPVTGGSAVAGPSNTIAKADALPEATSILVAEDNETNCLIIGAFLKRAGATTTIVKNGLKAVEACKHNQFDLILMDIHMPVMDGERALREIRSLEEKNRRGKTPVVAVTADAMDHQVRHYIELGFDGHMPKPINEKILVRTILENLTRAEPPALNSIVLRAANR
jgi:PAS domain S-box-containing protein